MTEESAIHEAVQGRYGAIALGRQSCCGNGDDSNGGGVELYDAEMLADLPNDVIGLSLGCGDPVTIAALNPGEVVLDLGSGGGIDCFLAAREVGETGRVIGLDMTTEMLEKANQNKAAMGVTNVEFRRGQIEEMPVEDNSVDVIMSNCVINLSPDKESVFAEAFRVLKPGGRVAVSDIVTDGDFSSEMRADTARWTECVTGAIDVNDYTGIMREAGFVNIHVADKVDPDGIVEQTEGMPRIWSVRVTAQKPATVQK